MTNRDLDILLVVNRENLIYFTGLTQIECLAVLIPRKGEPCAVTLWLDAEYIRQETGLATYGYFFPRESLVEKVVERIRAYGFQKPRIGFERYFVDFAVYDGLRRAFPEANFLGAGELFYRVRAVKETEEVEMLKRAAAAACYDMTAAMTAAVRAVRAGVTELDVLAEAEYAMSKAGSGGSPFRV